jgi:hypothetical protein
MSTSTKQLSLVGHNDENQIDFGAFGGTHETGVFL